MHKKQFPASNQSESQFCSFEYQTNIFIGKYVFQIDKLDNKISKFIEHNELI